MWHGACSGGIPDYGFPECYGHSLADTVSRSPRCELGTRLFQEGGRVRGLDARVA